MGIVTNKPQQFEEIGGYLRNKNFAGNLTWQDKYGRSIKGEVKVKNKNGKEYILKPDGTKVLAALRRKTNIPNEQTVKSKPITQSSTVQTNTPWTKREAVVSKNIGESNKVYYPFKTEQDAINAANEAKKLQSETIVNKNVNKRKAVVRRPNYNDNFAKLGLTNDERQVIQNAGFNPNNAEDVQKFILSQNQNANIGSRNKPVDGLWGSRSQTAFQALRDKGIFNKQKSTETAIDSPNFLQQRFIDKQQTYNNVIDSPNYGYKTPNQYNSGKELKELEFNNYSGLQKFAAGNTQFAKDLRQRFGQDVNKWDQNTVEKELGVSGTYRGSKAGDFGDMARSMQKWSQHTNEFYDASSKYAPKPKKFNLNFDKMKFNSGFE